MIGEAAGLLGNPIVSTLVGFIPDIVDWIDNEAYAKVDLSVKDGDAVEQ